MNLKVVSGGQSGVDRAALDAALESGVAAGGWCPKGRLAEDGRIPERYPLKETLTAEYSERTELNVRDSDATLILHRGPLKGGTALTLQLASQWKRPALCIDLEESTQLDRQRVQDWLAEHRIAVLNVAGPRESGSPGIYRDARQFLIEAFQNFS
jgi:hypothetical protein